ncbi:bifunctional folylpolyglutamate synthase/dihydrofolate synthase [Marinicella litoralis]|uniref:Dihydrofolate synthase/folylpolyglutamate synthase n=1 Tax=Marinicella litoralis TaxID=644220 RepID=A0A4R6XVQ0_9GAMM|nr:folylpolyglutamate synthase/dihydrofolate synthase family protein [Marinicella litoralis]TDR22490.1 dihydrofolate synthase/folylpolyglutamate synthase [Marinicella litoralis]
MTIQNLEQKSLLNQRLNELNQYKIDLGLDRLKLVLQRLKLSDINQTIITVGGTNGKGSTVAALSSLLKTQSKKLGVFTSPHIFNFNERIHVNGKEASDKEILKAFDLIDEVKQNINLSYFEYAFLAALLIFVENDVDVIILEVGLGGRLDATNAVDADVAVITTVDIDHIEWLGDDIEKIGKEKAGIMRSQKPIVFGDSNAPKSIIAHAQNVAAKLIQYNLDYQVSNDDNQFTFNYGAHQFIDLNSPALKGDWQLNNFSTALTALLELGYAFKSSEVQHSIDHWNVKGRLQTIQTSPLVLADVAHNKQAISHLVDWLRANPCSGKTRAVFSVLGDKQLDSWLGLLNDVVDHWFVFQLLSERGIELNSLKSALADHVKLFSVFESAEMSYQAALKCSLPEDRVIVFGSFHVLEEVFWQQKI